ncbi:MAG: DUF308 domain-containing protein [Galactobacter sp.]|uniref:DUF308 domain-containing protein n=1 Tax=Galactobacter sp. TaxID=2676125 RepID=UPI0025BEB72F|nr:DUF308 domain-containing protein [Galactobacter sp.]
MTSSPLFEDLKEFRDHLRKGAFAWLLTRGILGVLLGLLLFFFPLASGTGIATAIGVIIGIWLILDGGSSCALAFRERQAGSKWGWTLVGGVAAVIAGALALIFPAILGSLGGLMVLWFMAIGMMVRGVLELGDTRLGGWSIALGIINLLFGIFLAVMTLLNPGGTLLGLVWVGGIYGVVLGIASIVAAVKLRKA